MNIAERWAETHTVLVGGASTPIPPQVLKVAIEELSRAEEQVHQLREALTVTQQEYCNWICERHPEHTDECRIARAALAATEPKSGG